MAASGEITVTFDDIEGAAAAVRGVAANVDMLLTDLRAMLRPLVAEWAGAAAVNYQYQQHVWDLAAEDLHGVLLRIAAVLDESHVSYIDAEAQLRNMWGGQ
ncbi:MAG TPA: WXG100 family type VII secretion target [Actinocrinis sp.]|uniref:WXG100 family type VII secretion target n=1 Tax=Actinocrinis sp. TaxID=1920516 RepID=UPI002DDCFF81|nr:WXG100 family type VII secretion target [Actinocrinis sp.]HEV2347720.1 WXG100 family type VII secretion target [Actinocrinis sp.]